MRAMMENAIDAQSPQPATAGMRAMPQGVIGGIAHTQPGLAKAAMTIAAEATLRGDPEAVRLTEKALAMVVGEKD